MWRGSGRKGIRYVMYDERKSGGVVREQHQTSDLVYEWHQLGGVT